MAGLLTATWKGIYFPRAFSTWPIFFRTFPAIFSPIPSPSKSGSFVSSPTFSLIVPFTSCTLPAISFFVLGFIFLPLTSPGFGQSHHLKQEEGGHLFTSRHNERLVAFSQGKCCS